MKTSYPSSKTFLTLLLGLGVAAGSASAQTTFDNAAAANSLIQNAGNWDNGLPTSTNLGTINIDATYTSGSGGTMTGYFMTLTGGALSRTGGATFNLTDGSFTVDGATADFSYTGLGLTGTTYTFNSGTGTAATGTAARATNVNNSTATFNGGTSTFNREITLSNGGEFIVNSGATVTIGDGTALANTGFRSGTDGGTLRFNGGTTVAPIFTFDNAVAVEFGGTSAGSLSLTGTTYITNTAANILGSNVTLDWLTGSLMTFTVAGADLAFYETLWGDTVLQFNGGNVGAFGDIFQVSGETLSLVPEPSAFALLAGVLTLGFAGSRRRRS